jgi:DNA (cytosine-5)-methyltransferase 1
MCNGAISSQNNVHPGRKLPNGTYSDARVLTIYELMLLTGIPKN